jgi:hypothetical protein
MLRTMPSPMEPIVSPSPEALMRSNSMCSLGTATC